MRRIAEQDLQHVLQNIEAIAGKLSNKTIFVTGATGFFGKWLLETFAYFNEKLSLNAQLYALSRNPDSFLEEYPFYKEIKSIIFVKGNVKDFIFPDAELHYIIHAATEADAKLNAENPTEMLDTIIEGTKNMLELACKKAVTSFLLTSSGAVYGKQPANVTNIAESDNFGMDFTDPLNSYAEGKRVAELYSSIYFKKKNVPVKIARCFAFVGPYLPLDKHFAIGNFIKNGLDKTDIIIKGDGTTVRSYQYAADLIIWLWTILLSGKNDTPYNVGDDAGYSMEQLANAVKDLIPALNVKISGTPDPSKTIDRYVPAIKLSRAQLSLRNYHTLADSIKKTIKFYE